MHLRYNWHLVVPAPGPLPPTINSTAQQSSAASSAVGPSSASASPLTARAKVTGPTGPPPQQMVGEPPLDCGPVPSGILIFYYLFIKPLSDTIKSVLLGYEPLEKNYKILSIFRNLCFNFKWNTAFNFSIC